MMSIHSQLAFDGIPASVEDVAPAAPTCEPGAAACGADLLATARIGRVRALDTLSRNKANFFHSPVDTQSSASVGNVLHRLKLRLPISSPAGLAAAG
ncbi:hypothetical protein PMES_01238 [Profundibacterium mesophilum KAUST100406-0324]|uniref:Uncharacterized protein n=1 Tax=Profundibacterium mesophilum KAUST100406-0324 TaxID=1037889 RepID=A0A921NPZ7_9RHOB|nr:hypothetical protein PMES_01238 [Profundibacterium mesophilum KAUST100406-0324]